MNPTQPTQTLVVHMDQLTPENMLQLGQAGYSIMRDPNLIIFGRPLPESTPTLVPLPAPGDEGNLDGQEAGPPSISRNKKG